MEKPIAIIVGKVEIIVDKTLLDAFIHYLNAGKAGSKDRKDLAWSNEQIKRAEAGNPDPQELILFCLMTAGHFESAAGYTVADWTSQEGEG